MTSDMSNRLFAAKISVNGVAWKSRKTVCTFSVWLFSEIGLDNCSASQADRRYICLIKSLVHILPTAFLNLSTQPTISQRARIFGIIKWKFGTD